MQNNQRAAREALSFLVSHVRNDWSYPDVPPPRCGSDEEIRDVDEFRERYYGSSASASSEEEEAGADIRTATSHIGSGETGGSAAAGPSSGTVAANPYKFDSPESVGDAVERRRRARRRKLRMRQREEMGWNEGMRVFIERQEIWTGAATVRRHRVRVQKSLREQTRKHGEGRADMELDTTDYDDEDAQRPREEAQTSTVSHPPCPIVSPDESQAQKPGGNDDSDEFLAPLAPLAPRFLPDNPIRASIKPSVYSDIYSNIVVRSKTPSVPINLSDMTRALVAGWKSAGEWPPKANPIDPLPGSRRKAGAGTASSSRTAPGATRGEGATADGQFLSHHPHVKKGVDSVKKMLHLNGLGHHHGHHEDGAGRGH